MPAIYIFELSKCLNFLFKFHRRLYRGIRRKKKWMAEEVFDRIIGITDKETKRKVVEQVAGA